VCWCSAAQHNKATLVLPGAQTSDTCAPCEEHNPALFVLPGAQISLVCAPGSTSVALLWCGSEGSGLCLVCVSSVSRLRLVCAAAVARALPPPWHRIPLASHSSRRSLLLACSLLLAPCYLLSLSCRRSRSWKEEATTPSSCLPQQGVGRSLNYVSSDACRAMLARGLSSVSLAPPCWRC